MTDPLDPSTASPDPIQRFRHIFARVLDAGLAEATAMSLATADRHGRPSVRMVLLKDVEDRGFVFYTNLQSRKARELAENPLAALGFYWQPLEIQVRVEGNVEVVSESDADAYFSTRPRASQIGAWASLQSEPLASRTELETRIREFEDRFADTAVPRPPFWSGYRLVPDRVEFWYGKPNRLHERHVFFRDSDSPGGWRVQGLFP